MIGAMDITPIPYDPSFEHAEEDEGAVCDQMIETMRGIAQTTFSHAGHGLRGVHAKSHGLLRGELRVPAGLPAAHAQGAFAQPGEWPLVMRLSTIPGDILDDAVSTPRGMAIKLIGVDGVRLPGSEGAFTQDFVLVNGPVFGSAGPKQFLAGLKLLAATTDRVPTLKKAVSAVLRGAERAIEQVGLQSGTLKALGGHPQTHPLGDSYFSQVPMLWGPYMAKIEVVPVSAELQALTGAHVEMEDRPQALRDAVMSHFARAGGEWALRVQLCTDLETMPIEDASMRWPEDQSPFVTVARIVMRPQLAWTEARSAAIDDGMSFSPWHGLAAHRPLGAVMRVRKRVYEMSARFRAERNGVRMAEPRSADDLPP